MKYTVIVENIKMPIGHSDSEIISCARAILKKSGIIGAVTDLCVRKKSVDARKKDNIILVCSAAGLVDISGDTSRIKLPSGVKLIPVEVESILFGSAKMRARPVIVGFGPAGMFCALELARNGYSPIVYERGGGIDERVSAVGKFMNGGEFSESTNIQFGAGGAGTFSDGKLTTRIGDSLCRSVLETLCDLGAPSEILWQAKPHIGTDILRDIVKNADAEITSLGGEIKYKHLVSDITRSEISVNGAKTDYGALVLAIGHSSRDTYAELIDNEFPMTAKPFSVGVRIEHLREEIDYAMYGDAAPMLPPAEYAVSHRIGNRGVYSFCMCPGGVVVPAASEEGGVVTNGMSYSLRDGVNSNSALAVSVLPEDFDGTVSGAIKFQRDLERCAFVKGGGDYTAPAQTVGSFLKNDLALNKPGRICPTYMNGKVRFTDLGEVLPGHVSDMLKCGIAKFGRSISGFDSDDAILTGVETRTSAPVRIVRADDRRLLGDMGEIYPCGEGAGYAGGIMSAAVDGIKTARAIMTKFAPLNK